MNDSNKESSDEPLFYNASDIEANFKVCRRHITNLWKSGRIPQPVRLGGRLLWPRKAIEKWIDDGCPAIAV